MVVALAACALAAAIYFRRAPGAALLTRLSVSTSGAIAPQLSATMSPDGRQVAFVSTAPSGKLMLWVRALDSLEARVLPGTENAAHPFWSPDGRHLGFLAEGKVKKIQAGGGPVETLADSRARFGGSWSRDGMILFLPRPGELATVPAGGGPISTIVTRQTSGRDPSWPYFLPDGRHFLFYGRGDRQEQNGVYVGSLDSKETQQLVQTECKGAYASGRLLFMRDETLMARPFDVGRLELAGEPSVVADGIWVHQGAAQASFSVSQTGVLAYVNASLWNMQLAWFDRAGRPLGAVDLPGRFIGPPQLSPDARRVAIEQGPYGNQHIWLVDTAGAATSRITFGPVREYAPEWSADGTRIMFLSVQADGGSRLYVKDASGAGSEELVFESSRI